jgi:hypothetical protein
MAMVIQFADEFVKEFERLNLKVVAHAEGVTLEVQSTLQQEIRKWQLDDARIQKIKESMRQGEAPDFTEDEQGTVWFKNRLCVPETGNLRETILRKLTTQLTLSIRAVLRCTRISSRGIGGTV